MEADQLFTGRTISTDRLYISIESTNWLLDRGIAAVATLQKGRSGILSELFGTKSREIFSATCHFEKEKKNICLTSYTVKAKSKGKKNVVVLLTSRPLHDKTIDDGKGKRQIIKFYDFTKGGEDKVDQLNDYYTTGSKSCRWVMVALSYMLDRARVNGKTVWCLKNDSDTSSTSSYDFSRNLPKAGSSTCATKKFEWLGIQRAVEKTDLSWNSTFSRWASTESREKIHRNRAKEKMLPHKDRKRRCPNINWTVPIIWYQYLPGLFNASLLWFLAIKCYFIFHIHFAYLFVYTLVWLYFI